LLSVVVLHEEPQLEHERTILLETMANDLKSLRDYEDRTLAMLTESEQHLLDRHDLIDNLVRSKQTSDEIGQRVRENEINERQINHARQCYLSLAKRGSLLYFLLNDLSRLNVMYQFSLTWFQRTFHSCLLERDSHVRTQLTTPMFDAVQRQSSQLSITSQSTRHSMTGDTPPVKQRRNTKPTVSFITPEQRAQNLQVMVDRLTYTIYQLVSWSLFAEHQLLFSFLLTTTIARDRNEHRSSTNDVTSSSSVVDETPLTISKDEWTCFISPLLANPTDDKLNFVREQLPALYSQCNDLLLNKHVEFVAHSNPYAYLIQHENYKDLSHFQMLLLIKILRADMLLPSMAQYVIDDMGSRFLSNGFADIQDIYAHSSPQAPIILLLSPGRPTIYFSLYCREINVVCCYCSTRNGPNKSPATFCQGNTRQYIASRCYLSWSRSRAKSRRSPIESIDIERSLDISSQLPFECVIHAETSCPCQ
jgi:dynein heavy chain, axonemal